MNFLMTTWVLGAVLLVGGSGLIADVRPARIQSPQRRQDLIDQARDLLYRSADSSRNDPVEFVFPFRFTVSEQVPAAPVGRQEALPPTDEEVLESVAQAFKVAGMLAREDKQRAIVLQGGKRYVLAQGDVLELSYKGIDYRVRVTEIALGSLTLKLNDATLVLPQARLMSPRITANEN